MSPVSQMHNFVILKIEKLMFDEYRGSDLGSFSPLMSCSQREEMDTVRHVSKQFFLEVWLPQSWKTHTTESHNSLPWVHFGGRSLQESQ